MAGTNEQGILGKINQWVTWLDGKLYTKSSASRTIGITHGSSSSSLITESIPCPFDWVGVPKEYHWFTISSYGTGEVHKREPTPTGTIWYSWYSRGEFKVGMFRIPDNLRWYQAKWKRGNQNEQYIVVEHTTRRITDTTP